MVKSTEMNFAFLETATETLRAIAHPLRLAIIDLLHKNSELSVTEIFSELEIEQAVASHHLRILKDRNVVATRREGKNVHYYLTNPDYHTVVQVMWKVL